MRKFKAGYSFFRFGLELRHIFRGPKGSESTSETQGRMGEYYESGF